MTNKCYLCDLTDVYKHKRTVFNRAGDLRFGKNNILNIAIFKQ